MVVTLVALLIPRPAAGQRDKERAARERDAITSFTYLPRGWPPSLVVPSATEDGGCKRRDGPAEAIEVGGSEERVREMKYAHN